MDEDGGGGDAAAGAAGVELVEVEVGRCKLDHSLNPLFVVSFHFQFETLNPLFV